MRRKRRRIEIPLLILVFLFALPAARAEGDLSLVEFVPDGAFLVLGGSQLPGLPKRLEGSPLARAFCQGVLARRIKKSEEWAEMKRHLQGFKDTFGIDLPETLAQLTNEQVIVAFYPGEDPEEPDFLILTEGREELEAAPLLNRILEGFVNVGELTPLEGVREGDLKLKHFRNKEGDEFYTAAHDSHTLITNAVGLARKVRALAAGGRSDSLASNPRARTACEGLVEGAHFAAFLDVQAVLSALKPEIQEVPKPLRKPLRLLKALQGIGGAAFVHENGVSGRVRFAFDEEKLPKAVKEWIAKPDGDSWFAKFLPPDAVIAGGASRIEFAKIAKAILKTLPEGKREDAKAKIEGFQSLLLGGKSFLNELLPAMGPDVAWVLTDLDSTDKAPAELSLLLRLKSADGKEALGNLLRSLYGFSQLSGSEKEAEKNTLTETGKEVTFSRKEKRFTPTVSVADSALVLSTSLEAAKKLQGWISAPPPESVEGVLPAFKLGFFGVDFKALGAWMERHADFLAAEHARKKHCPAGEAEEWIGAVADSLKRLQYFMARGTTESGKLEIAAEFTVGP